MPSTLEDRRRAVVAALHALAAEPALEPAAVAEPGPVAEPELMAAVGVQPVVEAVVDAMNARLDELSGRLDEVLSRLGSVETAVLEAAWERPTASPPDEPGEAVADNGENDAAESDDDDAAAVSVPAVDMREGRMSTHAAKALFGH